VRSESIRVWRLELVSLGLAALICMLIGLIFDMTLPLLLVLVVSYLGWHLYNTLKFLKWLLVSTKLYPPQSIGVWGEIYYQVYHRQKQAINKQKNLVHTLKQVRQSSRAMRDGIVILDELGEIIWANQASETILGVNNQRDAGQRIGNLLRFPDFLKYEASFDYENNVEIPSPLDHKRIVSISMTSYAQDRRLLVARDVTTLRKLEQMRKDFVANVSHELNSPLTVIRGYLETIQMMDNQALDPFQKIFAKMDTQAERMGQIVKDLLLISKLESGQSMMDCQAVCVSTMVIQIVEESEKLKQGKRLDIQCHLESKMGIYGNEIEIRSALSNLVFNAVRYTPDGGKISIEWKVGKQGASFRVSDTGIGVAAEHIPRLTERFYRADDGRARDIGGTGLGLAIVKHVAERYQATLTIDSQLDKGSVFELLFPMSRLTATVTPPAL
jgi:two-component system, OmpR family, phosphate regulon sensor histidine kinase PhoR